MYHLRTPKTQAELAAYYTFRWEMLRKPLHQPEGSEKDGYDTLAHHQMVVDDSGQPVAIGRLYINAAIMKVQSALWRYVRMLKVKD